MREHHGLLNAGPAVAWQQEKKPTLPTSIAMTWPRQPNKRGGHEETGGRHSATPTCQSLSSWLASSPPEREGHQDVGGRDLAERIVDPPALSARVSMSIMAM